MDKKRKIKIDFVDAVEWIQDSIEIFYDAAEDRKENIRNLILLLQKIVDQDVDRILNECPHGHDWR